MLVYVCMFMYCYTQKGFICNKDYCYLIEMKKISNHISSLLKLHTNVFTYYVTHVFYYMINKNVKNLHEAKITKQQKIEYAAMFHHPVSEKKL